MEQRLHNCFDQAKILLDAAATALDGGTPDSMPAPVRRFVSMNQPVWDKDEQLAVHVANVRWTTDGMSATGFLKGPVMLVADFTVTLARCYPTTDKGCIAHDILTSAADILYADGMAVYMGVLSEIAGCYGKGNGCDSIIIGPMNPIGPEAGSAGWQFLCTLEISRS